MGLRSSFLMAGLLYLSACVMGCAEKRGRPYSPTFEAGKVTSGRRILTMGVPGQSFYETTDLLVQYLNDHLDSVMIQTVACSGIEDYEAKLRQGYFDLTFINGPQLLGAERNGYRVVGRIADNSQSVIFVRKDSGIHQFKDVSGHTISLPGKTTLSGSMMPLLFLYRHGVDVNGRLRREYVPSFESAMLEVYLGHAAIGTAWKPAWEMYLKQRPELASKLEVQWVTPPLVNAGVLFRVTTNSRLIAKVAGLLFGMGNDEQGRRALQRVNISGFAPADSISFRPMEAFLKEYNAVIH